MKDKKQNITTPSGLAKALGVSHQLIAWHQKKGGPKGYDKEEWEEYFAAKGRAGSAPAELRAEMAKEKLGILQEVRHAKKRENKIKDGETIGTALVTTFVQNLIGNIFFSELERMSLEFPVTLKGKGEVEIHEAVLKDIASLKKTLRTKLAAWESGEARRE